MNPHCQVVGPVFQEYREILARYIQSKVKDPIDSEELLSEVMMKIYDNCGHAPQLEKPQQFNSDLKEFIEKVQ